MKTSSPTSPLLFKIFLLAAFFTLVLPHGRLKAAGVPKASYTSPRLAVNFKHNTEKDELVISVKSGAGLVMQLFIFTPDGILIKEVTVSSHKITTIKSLRKGLYFYECFDNDERMKSGSLIIK